MDKQLVIYTRSTHCSDVARVRRDLQEWGIPFREVNIDQDAAAAKRLEEWTGFLSVPTVLIADGNSNEPYQEPAGLSLDQNPRNFDRGCMISEPATANLRAFLAHNGFLEPDLAHW